MKNKAVNPKENPNSNIDTGKKLFIKKTLFTGGLIGLAIGFYLLTWVDPTGQNWAGIVSPLLIISGYISIIIALLLKQQ